MKKIYDFFIPIVRRYFYLTIFTFFFTTIISGALIIGGKARGLYVIPFFSSVLGLIRLTTYKYGKIPFFMSDKTWNTMINKYGEEKAEELYKEMSLKQATGAFIVSSISICVSLIVEFLLDFVLL